MQSYGVTTNVKLYKCTKCGKQNRTGTVIQRSEYTPKKKSRKTQTQRAISIAKQVSLGQFKKMNQKMKPRTKNHWVIMCFPVDNLTKTDSEKSR